MSRKSRQTTPTFHVARLIAIRGRRESCGESVSWLGGVQSPSWPLLVFTTNSISYWPRELSAHTMYTFPFGPAATSGVIWFDPEAPRIWGGQIQLRPLSSLLMNQMSKSVSYLSHAAYTWPLPSASTLIRRGESTSVPRSIGLPQSPAVHRM